MWTPKRILIFCTAMAGFLALFAVAAFFGIGIDGSPKLPAQYLPSEGEAPEPYVATDDEKIRKIRQAFGNECEEMNRGSRIYLASKGVVLAIDDFKIEKDGRVRLSPFSAGLFPKGRPDQVFPEIHTVQCDEAFLTLDRPITSLTDLGRSKVIAVELGGPSGVKVTSNRKTFEKNDDLELHIAQKGKLFYEDARNLIWTNDYVNLLDTQSRPLPTTVSALGLEILLAKDAGPNRDKGAKTTPKKDGVSGIDQITLRSNVDMHLYIDSASGFLTSNDEAARKAKPKSGEKEHVHIKTNGKFTYDLNRETARFDAPENKVLSHDRVIVTRYVQKDAKVKAAPVTDQLECDHLDLQFRKKQGSTDKEIEFAIAKADPAQIVEMRLESEETHAFAAEMRYISPTAERGPQTILKGSPLHALRQGNRIQCVELHLKGADKKGNGQGAYAKGPGKIDLLNKQTGRHDQHILWQISLTSVKDKDPDSDRLFDMITLRGDAAFVDDEGKQEMRAAQFLHLWLVESKSKPDVNAPSPSAKDVAKDRGFGNRHRPHKIQGFENVQVVSADLVIRNANELTVCFREVPPESLPAPTPPKVVEAKPVVRPSQQPTTLANPGATGVTLNPPVPDQPAPTPVAKEKARKPVELTASNITAYVATAGSRKHLMGVVAEKGVHVHQEPDNPKDKGVDIQGELLDLARQAKGDILKVFGSSQKLAQLQFNEMLLFGPNVTIDQIENVASVTGTGAMHMPSNTTLDGKKKDSRITIHWSKSMVFNGRQAFFDGGVEAFQDNGKVRCREMQATLDQPVYFKPGHKNAPAKIDKIVCQGAGADLQPVYITDEERLPDGRLNSFRRLQMSAVEVDNLEQRMNGSGPGVLDFLSRGEANQPLIAEPGGEKKESVKKDGKDSTILKWTRVRFNGQMISFPTPAGNGRQTTFYDQIRVYHQPGDDPNVRDPVVVGKDGLFFTCQKLNIITRKVGDKNTQEMIADGGTGLVNFQSTDFQGNARIVKYDESQEMIIFEGNASAPATLFKMPKVPGAQPQRIQGTKILYNRKTGEFLLDGVRVISSWLMPIDRPAPDFLEASLTPRPRSWQSAERVERRLLAWRAGQERLSLYRIDSVVAVSSLALA